MVNKTRAAIAALPATGSQSACCQGNSHCWICRSFTGIFAVSFPSTRFNAPKEARPKKATTLTGTATSIA
ncbi:MAG TPA: hypothetical protein DCK76_01240 [Desulfotomaculum sp.]|nr:MAG: hypothetical protein XD84_1917 [Desulfotomaculum sp. 46_80]HAG10038.1 hypothetical protein [Desulfotomaculum sp.]HBY04514.1 hypothetical protein [Desulfotomaculum sp.]